MEHSVSVERRRHPRIAVEVQVQLQPLASAEVSAIQASTHTGISRDVSESGMRVWADRLFPVNSKLLLTFECRELGWNCITSRVGSVVWAETLQAAGKYLLGIKFGDVDELHGMTSS